jgi:hypothetical protein
VLVAIGAGVVMLLGFRKPPDHMHQLHAAIAESDLDRDSKVLLGSLALDRDSWTSGLIHELLGPTAFKRVAWHASFRDDKGRYMRVFILDAYLRPIADTPVPPTCIVTDANGRLVSWASIAPWSSGFITARLAADGTLTVTTVANWFHGTGTYSYRIRWGAIDSIGDAQFAPLSPVDRPLTPPAFFKDRGRLRELLEKLHQERTIYSAWAGRTVTSPA